MLNLPLDCRLEVSLFDLRHHSSNLQHLVELAEVFGEACHCLKTSTSDLDALHVDLIFVLRLFKVLYSLACQSLLFRAEMFGLNRFLPEI